MNNNDKKRLGFTEKCKNLSHATIGYILQNIDISSLELVLGEYIFGQINSTCDENFLVNIDGKTLRGSRSVGGSPTHLVSLFCDKISGVLGQQKSSVGGGEIGSALDLLSKIDLKNMIITGDAMFSNEKICQSIKDQGGDYIFTVKNNQKQLVKDIETAFEDEKHGANRRIFKQEIDKKHGRIEQRSIQVIDMTWEYQNGHATIKQIAKLERYRFENGKESRKIVHLITSLDKEKANPKMLLQLNRDHWAIENKLHYQRDTAFKEDHSTIRKGNAPQAKAEDDKIAHVFGLLKFRFILSFLLLVLVDELAI